MSQISNVRQFMGLTPPRVQVVTSGGKIDIGPDESVVHIMVASDLVSQTLRLSTTPLLSPGPVFTGRLLRLTCVGGTIQIPHNASNSSMLGNVDGELSNGDSCIFEQQSDGSWQQMICAGTSMLERLPRGEMWHKDRHGLFEPFDQLPLINAAVLITDTSPTLAQMALRLRANRNFEVIENTGATAVASGDVAFNARGGMRLTTKTTANDAIVVRPHLDTDQTAWAAANAFLSDSSPRVETQVNLPAITACIARFGLFEDTAQPADLATVGSDDNAAFFIFDEDNATSATKWVCVVNSGGVDTFYDSGVAVSANAEYRLEIRVDSLLVPRFYINGVLVATGAALTTAISFVPMVAIATDTAGAKTMDVRYIRAGSAH